MNPLLSLILTDALWVIVFAGWILLIVTGLEADKPLSGGIPGHVDAHELHRTDRWHGLDRLGEIGGWTVFGLVAASLPVILYWIFTVHPR
jgi:hypothetical protein